MDIVRVDKEVWREKFSENAHNAGFKRYKDATKERIDFALVAIKDDEIKAYVTCRELDSESLYFQFGASLGNARGTKDARDAWLGFIEYAKAHYQRVAMLVENDNWAMMKMAIWAKLKITGIRYFKNYTLLEHSIEWGNDA